MEILPTQLTVEAHSFLKSYPNDPEEKKFYNNLLGDEGNIFKELN